MKFYRNSQVFLWLTVVFLLPLPALAALSVAECKKNSSAKAPVFGAECGFLSVRDLPAPDARDKVSAPPLDVYVLRIPAIRKSSKPPIFFIAGGPGQASTDLAENFRYQFHALLIEHDFVFVDQRGTGKSAALECDADLKNQQHLTQDELAALTREQVAACIASYEMDLTRFTTPYAVHDLEQIRRQLAYDKIFLWGGSYGTRVVLQYVREHAPVVAGAIMDGLAPIAIQLPTHSEADANAALEGLLANCAAQSACAAAFPDLRSRWLALLQQLQDQPQRLQLSHPRTQESLSVYVDHSTVSAWVRLSLYNRDISSLLPLAMDQAARQDFSRLFSIQALSLDSAAKHISEGMHLAVVCAEDRQLAKMQAAAPQIPAEIPAVINEEKLLHLPAAAAMDALCDLLPPSTLSESYFSPVHSSVPSLLLSGDFDPVTPRRWAERVQSTLSSSKHVLVAGGHHIVSPLGCMPDVIKQFVAAPTAVAALNSECSKTIQPLPFFIDGAGPLLDLGSSKVEVAP